MRGMNQLVLVGHLGATPELRSSETGAVRWTQLSVATSRSKKCGEEWVEETDWHRVKVFGAEAERCERYLGKGDLVGIEGTLCYERWTDPEGKTRSSAVVRAGRVQFLKTKSRRSARETAAQ